MKKLLAFYAAYLAAVILGAIYFPVTLTVIIIIAWVVMAVLIWRAPTADYTNHNEWR